MFQLNRNKQDLYFNLFLKVNGFFSAIAVLLIFLFLIKEAIPSLNITTSSFFLNESWFPSEGKYNIFPMLVGSLAITLGAVTLAFPLGLFTALFSHFYGPTILTIPFRRIIELYSGIPSVIFGFWGLMKIVPLINKINPPGQSLLAGIIVLALMIFPIITLNLISGFEMSSNKLYRISESLGIRKSKYIWGILIPQMKKQIVGITLLSLGRAIGETMAVLMVCGNIVKIPDSIFSSARTLTANIALEMSYAMGTHRSALFLSGLVLLIIVSFLFFISDKISEVEV